jgi:hypothetical protein
MRQVIRTILQEVRQGFYAVLPYTPFRFVRGDERNNIVGKDFSVCVGTVNVRIQSGCYCLHSLDVHFVELRFKPFLESGRVLVAKEHGDSQTQLRPRKLVRISGALGKSCFYSAVPLERYSHALGATVGP